MTLRYGNHLLAGAVCLILTGQVCLITLEQLKYGALAVALGCLLLAVSLRNIRPAIESPSPDIPKCPSSSAFRRGSLVALLGISAITTASVCLTASWREWFFTMAPLQCLGVLLVIIGTDVAQGYLTKSFPVVLWRWTQTHFREIFFVLAVTLLAGTFRFVGIEYFPPIDGTESIEEQQAGQLASSILHDGMRPWVWIQTLYPAALAFTLLSESISSLRTMSAVVGTLATIPIYLTVRRLTTPQVARISILLFAIGHWHVICSRFGHNVYHGVLYSSICLAFYVYATQSQRVALWVLLGTTCALQLYDYDVFKWPVLLIPLAVGYRFLRGLYRRTPSVEFANAAPLQVLSFGSALLLTAIPNFYFAYTEPQSFFSGPNRMFAGLGGGYYDYERISQFIELRAERLGHLVRFFFAPVTGASFSRMNIPETPFVDPITGTLLLCGIVAALARPFRQSNMFFLVAFLLLNIGGGMMHEIWDVQRMAGLVPIVFVLVGRGIADCLLPLASLLVESTRSAFVQGAGIAAIGIASFVNVSRLHAIMGDPTLRSGMYDHYVTLVRELNATPVGTLPIVLARYPTNIFLPNDYSWQLRHAPRGWVSQDLTSLPDLLRAVPADRDVVVLVQKPYDLVAAQNWIEAGAGQRICTLPSEGAAADYELLRCVLKASRRDYFVQHLPKGNLRAQYRRAGVVLLERNEPYRDGAFTPSFMLESAGHDADSIPIVATWNGMFHILETGVFRIAMSGRFGSYELRVDGNSYSADQEIRLSPGAHTFHLTADFIPSTEASLSFALQADGVSRSPALSFWQ